MRTRLFPIITLLFAGVLYCCSGGTSEQQQPQPKSKLPAFYERSIPPMGELSVVRIDGETYGRKLLAATMQGMVNSRKVRMYLVDGDQNLSGEAESQRHWLAYYAAQYGMAVGSDIRLDDALELFAKEASGYILASEDEPWTINAASTLSGLVGALAATGDEASLLDSAGLSLIEDMRGRWSSAEECIRDTFETLYPQANPLAIAILYPFEYRARDFFIQNRVFTIYGRPAGDEGAWEAVQEVLRQTPQDQPVFGYLSLDGIEEYQAILAISSSGKFLNPTSNVSNLSVHSAVPAELPKPQPVEPVDCAKGSLRVAIAITDGDNLLLPLHWYVSERYWLSPERGNFPIGWSLSPALISLAPGIADYYLTERSERDEFVGLLGIGYAHPTELPDTTFFLDASFDAFERLGMTSLWFIDPNLDPSDTENPIWEETSRGYTESSLAGLLLGFFNFTGSVLPDPFRTPSGMPVILSGNTYFDGPDDIEGRIQAALDAWRGGGPDVFFICANAWINDLGSIAGVVGNLADEGDLTFMTPSQLLKCLEE